jgi:putative resolvase
MLDQYPGHTVVSDVGSGLNFKRKGLLSLLEQSKRGHVQEIVVASKDRLCRFGFDLLAWTVSSSSFSSKTISLQKQKWQRTFKCLVVEMEW